MRAPYHLSRVVWWLIVPACAPVLDDDTPYVSSPRVLAVRVDPPEVVAGAEVHLTALYADATGALGAAPLDWAFCGASRPLAELGPVAGACLDPSSEALLPIGAGLETVGTVPADACSLFGPNPPPPVDGAPGGRPVDPDVTGGFYQPALGFDTTSGSATFVPVRVRCGLANVSQETYIAWNSSYRSNESPSVASVSLVRADGEQVLSTEGAAPPPEVGPGEVLTVRISWPDCPEIGVCGDGVCSSDEDVSACAEDCTTPRGCDGAETYVVYQPDDATLHTRREGLSATWFATGGTLDDARNGREGTDTTTTLDNGWTAPERAGEVWIAVALRDERGGVSFASFRVRVAP